VRQEIAVELGLGELKAERSLVVSNGNRRCEVVRPFAIKYKSHG